MPIVQQGVHKLLEDDFLLGLWTILLCITHIEAIFDYDFDICPFLKLLVVWNQVLLQLIGFIHSDLLLHAEGSLD